MAEKISESRINNTTWEAYLDICKRANLVVDDLDRRRRKAHGRAYHVGDHYSELVPGTEVRLSYIPLPGSSAYTSIQHATTREEVLHVSSEYFRNGNQILPQLDRGGIGSVFYDTERSRTDLSISRTGAGDIRLRAPGYFEDFSLEQDIFSLKQDDLAQLQLVFRGLNASIRAAEAVRDGSSFQETMRIRQQEFIDGI